MNGKLELPVKTDKIDYTEPPFECDGTYRSVFGPSYDHSGMIYSNCNFNLNLASTRAFGAIKNNYILTRILSLNQQHFITTHHTELVELRRQMCEFYSHFDMHEEARIHHADPHPKAELRKQAYIDATESGNMESKTWFEFRPNYKMKKDEVAKHLKAPRCIGDLGVLASLAGFRMTKYMKSAMASIDYVVNGIRFIFCPSPKYAALKRIFELIVRPEERGTFVCFSDDSCLGVRQPDGSFFWANLDISSCDKSHTDALFESFHYLAPDPDCADVLLAQCKAPIKIYPIVNGKMDRTDYLVVTPNGYFLYSGSTITTMLNNLANFNIFLSIAELDLITVGTLKRAASRAGYLITVEPCERVQEIQFLKHSPAYDVQGVMQPLLNVGVFLRSSGRCRGDLPGRGCIRKRAAIFHQQFTHGMYPRIDTPFINNHKGTETLTATIRQQRHLDRVIDTLTAYKVETEEEDPTLTFSTTEFFARYKLDALDEADMIESSQSSGYGWHFANDATKKILKLDYGLTVPS